MKTKPEQKKPNSNRKIDIVSTLMELYYINGYCNRNLLLNWQTIPVPRLKRILKQQNSEYAMQQGDY